MRRRKFIYHTALVSGGLLALPNLGFAFTNDFKEGPFDLPKLPYAYDALEPFIDEQTMRIHHGKHFQGYTDNLNKAIEGTGFLKMPIEDILKNIKPTDTAIRNNGGGYYNHDLFFASLSPDPKKIPTGKLMDVILRDFGSYNAFQNQLSQAALSVFGSGWAWLTVNQDGLLFITSTHNQDNPLMSFSSNSGIPLIGIDVWEHAYYLKYQNKRKDYVDAFFNVLDWKHAEEIYDNL